MHRILAGSACKVPSVTGMRRLWAHRSVNQARLHDMGRGRAVVFLRTGGMRAIEEKAAAAAVADARELWPPTLQGWHAKAKGTVRSLLAGEIRRLATYVPERYSGRLLVAHARSQQLIRISRKS